MHKRVCLSCMTVFDAQQEICPCCGTVAAANKNPAGALPEGLLLHENYRIGAFVSIDSEGSLYEAMDVGGRRPCRIKEYMPVTLCSGRGEDLALQVRAGSEVPYKNNAADFVDLYTKLQRLSNDICLLGVREVFPANNTVYAVIEQADGVTLGQYLERRGGRIGWNEALDLLDPLWVSVEKLHRAGIIHRGICCDSITVTGPGVLRLGGYAIQAMRSQGTELKAQLCAGYAAPEQYSASDFDGAFTDIYALCAVLYRMVTGVTVPSARERLHGDTLEDPTRYTAAPLPDGSVQKLPLYLADAILHGLQLDAADRFADMQSFRMALAGRKPAVSPVTDGKKRTPGGAVRTEPEKKNLWTRMSVEFRIALCTFGFLAAVFAIVLGVWYNGRELPPDSTMQPDSGISVTESASSISQPESEPVSSAPEQEAVLAPQLTGSKYNDIRLEYANFRFSVSYEHSNFAVGTVIRQTPEHGEEVTDNTIAIVVSQGMEPIPMPDIEGNTRASAESLLTSLGIKYEIITVINDGSWASDVVTETNPGADVLVQPGVDTVILRVSTAKPEISSEEPSSAPQESVPEDGTPESDAADETGETGETGEG